MIEKKETKVKRDACEADFVRKKVGEITGPTPRGPHSPTVNTSHVSNVQADPTPRICWPRRRQFSLVYIPPSTVSTF